MQQEQQPKKNTSDVKQEDIQKEFKHEIKARNFKFLVWNNHLL